MINATRAWCWLMPMTFAVLVAGCATPRDRYKLPPPRNTQPLSSAHGAIYAKDIRAPPVNPTSLCITSAGYCPLPAPTETGLPCTCESTNPEFSYGGRTGPIPPMPDWADPNMKQLN